MSIRAPLLVYLIVHAFACGPGGPGVGGARSFAEIDVAAATRSIEHEQARLVQVRDANSPDPRAPAATMLGPDEAVPDAWLEQAHPILVIANDEAAARKLAARLLRLGAPRVSVVRGGIEAWSEPGDDRMEPPAPTHVGLSKARDAKPTEREPARRTESWQQSQK